MKKSIAGLILIFLLAGCSYGAKNSMPKEQDISQKAVNNEEKINLEDLGPAPELNNKTWLNTDQPIRLADQRGKVILLEMWTFG